MASSLPAALEISQRDSAFSRLIENFCCFKTRIRDAKEGLDTRRTNAFVAPREEHAREDATAQPRLSSQVSPIKSSLGEAATEIAMMMLGDAPTVCFQR